MKLHWRLVYADDSRQDEPPDDASILLSRPGAVVLMVTRDEGELRTPIVQVPLPAEAKPVFYRKRSMTMGGHGGTRTDATVFGHASMSGPEEGNSKLWALAGESTQAVDCPAHWIDATMVAHQAGCNQP